MGTQKKSLRIVKKRYISKLHFLWSSYIGAEKVKDNSFFNNYTSSFETCLWTRSLFYWDIGKGYKTAMYKSHIAAIIVITIVYLLMKEEDVRKDVFKLEGGELFKEGFRNFFKTRMNLSQEPIDSIIQLAKTASKSYSTRKTIGCFVETIGCLYQQTTNKLNLKS